MLQWVYFLQLNSFGIDVSSDKKNLCDIEVCSNENWILYEIFSKGKMNKDL